MSPPTERSAVPRSQLLLACAVAPVLALLCYWRTLGFDLVWDDATVLAGVTGLTGWESVRDWIFAPFLDYGYFRPLGLLTLALDGSRDGATVQAYHLGNVLLHAANAAMVSLLAGRLARDAGRSACDAAFAALAAGAFYAIHPALIEGVSWISARFDLLTAFFGLGALLADRWFARTSWRALAGATLFFCAALCKEMILGLACALPLWHLLAEQGRDTLRATVISRRHGPVYAAYALAGLAYLTLRGHFLGGLVSASASIDGSRLLLIGKTLARYCELAVWPFPLIGPVHYLAPLASGGDLECWAGLALAAVVAAGVCRASGPLRVAALAAACFLLSLLPVSQLLPLAIGDSFAADRYLQFPLVFVALLPGLFAGSVRDHARIARIAAAGVAVLWIFLAALAQLSIVPHWGSERQLWAYAYARAPLSKTTTYNLMSELVEDGDLQNANALAEKVRDQQGGQFYPAQQMVYASLLGKQGRYMEALDYLRGAEPGLAEADIEQRLSLRHTWGMIALEAGDLEQAQAQLTQAGVLAPSDASIHYFRGLALMALGRAQQAREQLDEAYRLAPDQAAQWRAAEAGNVAVAAARWRQHQAADKTSE